jgi:hypothetical protein
LLPAVGPEAVHEATGTLLVLAGAQVVVVQLLPEDAACAEHELTPTGPVVTVLQVVVV